MIISYSTSIRPDAQLAELKNTADASLAAGMPGIPEFQFYSKEV